MIFDDLFENIPDHVGGFFHHTLGALHIVSEAALFDLAHDKGLKEFQSHLFGEAALVHFQFRADDDDRAAGIVDALAQEVLTEAPLFAFEQIREGFQGTVAGAGHSAATAAIINEGVHRFLQHAFFVAHDDVRRSQRHELLQTVVAVNHTAIEIVQVGSGKTAAIQLHHRTQFRGQHRQNGENHPLGLIAGLLEGLDDLQTFDQANLFLAAGSAQFLMQLSGEDIEVDRFEQFENGLRAHTGVKRFTAVLGHGFAVLRLRDEFFAGKVRLLRIEHHVGGKIQHLLDIAGFHVEHEAHAGRRAPEIPDVGAGGGQFNVPHALTAHLGAGHFDAAAVADDTAITDFLIFAAVTFPVLGRPEDAFAEEAVALRFQRAVVDGFRLFYFAVRPFQNFLRRGQTNSNTLKIADIRHCQPHLFFVCIGVFVSAHVIRSIAVIIFVHAAFLVEASR